MKDNVVWLDIPALTLPEKDTLPDDLAFIRGCIIGSCVSLVMWAGIILLVFNKFFP